MTYGKIYEDAVARIEESGSEEPESDAWLLFGDTFGFSRTDFFLKKTDEIAEGSQTSKKLFDERVMRRMQGEPVQYILGNQDFYGLNFKVDERVLIPRADTEILVEELLKCDTEGKTILDLCTGSGCILIAAMKKGGFSAGTGTDISPDALCVAKENAILNNVSIRLCEGDLFEAVDKNEKYDYITANPPYISPDEKKEVQEQVLRYEPHEALFAQEGGLLMYKRILQAVPDHLNAGGRIFFEIGYSQAGEVTGLCKKAGLTDIKVIKDLAGLDRVVTAKKE